MHVAVENIDDGPHLFRSILVVERQSNGD